MQLRPASDEPSSGLSVMPPTAKAIRFIHPGYAGEPESATFLLLPAYDDGGIDYNTALVACGIIAGNRWADGFFSVRRDGGVDSRVSRPDDGILRAPQYFFHIPGYEGDTCGPYPIVARFSDWRFPHMALPDVWERLRLTAHFSRLDALSSLPAGTEKACVLSHYRDSVEMAHLVPTSQKDWFSSNRLHEYVSTSTYSLEHIDSIANLVSIRADLHRIFDERRLCFVPKAAQAAAPGGSQLGPAAHGDSASAGAGVNNGEMQLVVHVFSPTPSGQLPALWHNRSLHRLNGDVSLECLFARFAWTILAPGNFNTFLAGAPVSRRLFVWNAEKGAWDTENVDRHRCFQIWNGQRSRSPKKRSAPPADGGRAGNNDDRSDGGLDDSGYFGSLTGSVAESEEKNEPRGRTMKRKAEDIEVKCIPAGKRISPGVAY